MVIEPARQETVPSFPEPSTFKQLPGTPARLADVIAPDASTLNFEVPPTCKSTRLPENEEVAFIAN